MITKNNAENASIFICEKCDFKCCKKSNYEKHLTTRKHQTDDNELHKKEQKMPKKHRCICGKEYNFRQGLYTHRKTCDYQENSDCSNESNTNEHDTKDDKIDFLIKENIDFKKIILDLVKNNSDFQKQALDMQSKMIDVYKPGNTIISQTNSNNKTFNLQVFLNEDCKDAMNLSEFVNSLQLQLSDLDNMGKLGYTEGISKIIMTEMNELEQTKRPVHCSDIKRETLYVKDEDKWEKEQPDYPKLNKAIRKIEQKNFGLMSEWQAEHPTYMESTSEENNEFLKLVAQTVNGTPDNINKVIKKIAKEVVIDK
jgi:hypothetical protein